MTILLYTVQKTLVRAVRSFSSVVIRCPSSKSSCVVAFPGLDERVREPYHYFTKIERQLGKSIEVYTAGLFSP